MIERDSSAPSFFCSFFWHRKLFCFLFPYHIPSTFYVRLFCGFNLYILWTILPLLLCDFVICCPIGRRQILWPFDLYWRIFFISLSRRDACLWPQVLLKFSCRSFFLCLVDPSFSPYYCPIFLVSFFKESYYRILYRSRRGP